MDLAHEKLGFKCEGHVTVQAHRTVGQLFALPRLRRAVPVMNCLPYEGQKSKPKKTHDI